MNFSDKLKEIRRCEGLSQEQLAERIGVSRQAITKWETGKGLPDIENMMILAEIFKTTIDELVNETASRNLSEDVFSSETVYDIDREKHFDIHIGSAFSLTLSTGSDEKLHVRLRSKTVENLGELFKIKLDDHRNRLDVDCVQKNKISRFEAEEALEIEILLPAKYTGECELAASVRLLNIQNFSVQRLEFDGDAGQITIRNASGKLDFTSKTDYEVSADRVNGTLGFYQFRAKTLLHIPAKTCPAVRNKGRKCSVYFLKDGEKTEVPAADGENAVCFSGIGSELIVDLT